MPKSKTNTETCHPLMTVPTGFVIDFSAERGVTLDNEEAERMAKMASEILAHVGDEDLQIVFWALHSSAEWVTSLVQRKMINEGVA